MTLPSNDPRSAMPTAERRMATPAPIRRRALLAGLGATGATAVGAAISAPTAAAAPRRGAWPDWIDVTRRGAKGDGEHDVSRVVSRILDEIGSDHATMYFPHGRYALDDDLAVPPNVLVAMDNGAILQPTAGTTITIAGPLSAGPYQVFGGEGAVEGRLGAGVALPQWWGARADGGHDDTPAINAAIHALYAAGGETEGLQNSILTSVRMEWEELGRAAADLLSDRSSGRLTGAAVRRLVPARVIPRLSCVPGWTSTEALAELLTTSLSWRSTEHEEAAS